MKKLGIKEKNILKGISLISLIIMIIVIVIIAGAVIISLINMDVISSGKQAKFMNNFRTVEEGILLYMTSNKESLLEGKEVKEEKIEIASIEEVEILNLEETEEEKIKRKYPVTEKFTTGDRQKIKGSTLEVDILSKTGKKSIMEVDTLYWVDMEKIGVSIPGKSYLLDIETMQVYEYEGEKIKDEVWHTLEGGIGEDEKNKTNEVVEIWDGWIRLTLYYPDKAENREWRLSTNGETRQDSTLFWQEYTGPIVIPVDRVQDVWIRYTIDGEAYVSGGTVDIEPDSKLPEKKEKVKVKINYYGNNISKKEYRIDGGEWRKYTGAFTVYENCLIEARCRNEENEVKYADPVEILNIEKKEPLPDAPDIMVNLIPTEENEKEEAVVSIYPPEIEKVKKIYVSINGGEYKEYTRRISSKRKWNRNKSQI